MADDKETVTIQEAMRLLHRSEKSVRNYIKHGRLTGKIGDDGLYHIPRLEVLQMVKNPAQLQADRLEKVIRRLDQIEHRLIRVEELLVALTSIPGVIPTLPTIEETPGPPQEHKKKRPLSIVQKEEEDDPPGRSGSGSGSGGGGAKGLPDGAILASAFASRYGVAGSTFRDHYKKGIGPEKELAPVSQRPKPGREHMNEVEYYILPDQVAGVLEYWRRHGVKFLEPE